MKLVDPKALEGTGPSLTKPEHKPRLDPQPNNTIKVTTVDCCNVSCSMVRILVYLHKNHVGQILLFSLNSQNQDLNREGWTSENVPSHSSIFQSFLLQPSPLFSGCLPDSWNTIFSGLKVPNLDSQLAPLPSFLSGCQKEYFPHSENML